MKFFDFLLALMDEEKLRWKVSQLHVVLTRVVVVSFHRQVPKSDLIVVAS